MTHGGIVCPPQSTYYSNGRGPVFEGRPDNNNIAHFCIIIILSVSPKAVVFVIMVMASTKNDKKLWQTTKKIPFAWFSLCLRGGISYYKLAQPRMNE